MSNILITTADGYIVYFVVENKKELFWKVKIPKNWNKIKRIKKLFALLKKNNSKKPIVTKIKIGNDKKGFFVLMSSVKKEDFKDQVSFRNIKSIHFIKINTFIKGRDTLETSIKKFFE